MKPKQARAFDWSKYSTRLVALKFAYLGQNYNGLEHHSKNETPLPTIEEELWKALRKAYLICPESNTRIDEGEVNWEGCDYSKCGRTDKGVSAFGQVIGIRLRSNHLSGPSLRERLQDDYGGAGSKNSKEAPYEEPEITSRSPHSQCATNSQLSSTCSKDEHVASLCPVDDEIPYVQILNRLLPPDIRMLAWCPIPPPDFSARFSCKERRYKYFFTQPAFTPTYGSVGFRNSASTPENVHLRREGWMDIEAMRDAAKKFEGLHDFRNFCKIDASKQIDNFERRIFHADIDEVSPSSGPLGYIDLPGFQERPTDIPNGSPQHTPAAPNSSTPKIYTFTLHGSGFLWHQVRHMVAILFLIGQGLEFPSLIDDLLDINKTPEKPIYDMADDAPLVLSDCIFPREGGDPHEDGLDWVYAGAHTGDNSNSSVSRGKGVESGKGKHGAGGVVHDLWKVWRRRKIDEVLAGRLLDIVVRQGNPAPMIEDDEKSQQHTITNESSRQTISQKVFLGGDAPRAVGRYVPVLSKPRMASVAVLNARYAARKGFEQHPEAREQGFRHLVLGRAIDADGEGR